MIGYQVYKKILKNSEWIYCPRYNNESSYERVMSADFVVFADSTLGYERLSRGKKTLSLPFGCENPKWCKKIVHTRLFLLLILLRQKMRAYFG